MPRRYDTNGWATVVTMDPGGTTGWSVMCVEPDALSDPDISVLASISHWAHGQITGSENHQANAMADLIAVWDGAAFVMESFTLRKFTQGDELLSPVRLISKMDYIIEEGLRGVLLQPEQVWYQSSSLAMKTATDDRLKTWGLYERAGGMGHARDADRHAITFLRRASTSKQIRHLSWPHLFDKHGNLIDEDDDA